MGCNSFLQGIFPTQGSNPCLPHSRWILYCLSHKGSPLTREARIKCQMLPLDCQTQGPWFFTFLPGHWEKSFSLLKLPILHHLPLGLCLLHVFGCPPLSIPLPVHLGLASSLHRPCLRELLLGDDTTSYANLALPCPVLPWACWCSVFFTWGSFYVQIFYCCFPIIFVFKNMKSSLWPYHPNVPVLV